MKKICITGANGFIGKSICKALSASGNYIRGFVRTIDLENVSSEIEHVPIGDISLKINWKDQLKGFDCIIHCAGITQNISSIKNQDFYHLVNVDVTKRLAEQAAEAGVKRLIFLSSVKVYGESIDKTNIKKKFFYDDIPTPIDDYGISKLKAEKELWEISSRTNLEIIVLRLPLVYGHNAKGNIARLIKLIKLGIPLPLSMVKNHRSMIGIDNLVDLLICCVDHSKANGKTFLPSDGDDLSTPELINLIASSMGQKARLFPMPIFLLKFLGFIFDRKEEINRLLGSLRIDNSYIKETLNWLPPINVKEGIRRMVQGK